MKMRWHLIMKDEGKVKARLILLGFQDPRLATIEKASPTISSRGRNLALQLMANNKLRIYKGDVKAAFLQGDATQAKRDLLVEPVPELREALQLAGDECVKMLKAAYGLVNVPPRSGTKKWQAT